MKLLITTQVVDRNDPDLGFFHRWLEEFAKHCERVEVICLYEGEYALPENVFVHSLGKEKGESSRAAYAARFLKLIFELRKNYDAVFVHMNPEYVVLGGLWWRLWRKRVALWYLHKSVNMKLRLAVSLASVVVTASKESFRLPTKKVRIVGHGIAIDEFGFLPKDLHEVSKSSSTTPLRLVTTGRISPAKKVDRILDALEALHEREAAFTFDCIGTAGRPEDRWYESDLRARIAQSPLKEQVHFLGAKPHAELVKMLPDYDLFLHASTGTGSVDKAVLEALVSGVPVVSTSEAFRTLLSPYDLFVREAPGKETGERMAAAVMAFVSRTDRESIRRKLHEIVAREYSLDALVPRILGLLEKQSPIKNPEKSVRSLLKLVLYRFFYIARNVLDPIFHFTEVSVLAYHSISNDTADTAIRPKVFESQLKLLASHGVSFVSIHDVVAWQQGKGSLPKKAVAITFDDGYADFETAALPFLEKHQIPVTLFVVGSEEASRPALMNEQPLLSIEGVERVRRHPLVTIGYHSFSHANLDKCAGEDLAHEVRQTGPAEYFAFPGGHYSTVAIAATRDAGYVAAFSIKPTLVSRKSNLHLLPRAVVTSSLAPWEVLLRTTKAIAWYRFLTKLSLFR
jgi:peptidoglycan/xylan/chitin deacetylase (PgdA/CDA1 family)/glycosyltransferase involved in cell wall biosynthesis